MAKLPALGWVQWHGRGSLAIFALAVVVGLGAVGKSSMAGNTPLGGHAPPAAPNHLDPRPSPPTATTSVATSTTRATTTTTAIPALRVGAVTPRDGAKGVSPTSRVVVTYNRPPSAAVPYPAISPHVAGQWSGRGTSQFVFKPTGYWAPGTTYHLWRAGRNRAHPGVPPLVSFSTRLPSVLTLQQYLATLGYLPLRFTPTGDIPNRISVIEREPAVANLVPQVPAPGVFTWAYPDVPGSLWAQWHRGKANVVTTGAVMQFELAHGLAPDGDPGPLVWNALLRAVAQRQMNTSPYNYVIVSETLPETLYVWQDGRFVYNTLTNTGVPGATTPQGTWPVAYKQNPNLMKGCDVSGACYSVWVAFASYFLPSVGDAVHAYPRYGYGYPQSNGCVEVPPSQGQIVYSYDPVGTLVTVTSWVGPGQHP